ncbi:hypothetical protein SL053_002188 [Flavobacterium psychrophilum]|uniref:Uncharacterized protein n=1 Tax=Flavobacterium psychrophilum TaxID=96345 RepID=A0A7U2NFI1_FLAPS|nr:hypothetical protein [Flavobacterium psychrophilum]ELM3643549.1 hypothetical protein [Flavobacterium psychrophilum]ELM3651076.1 hypothetical protein [Flavobacterium psychrophilum]ELM3670991.1 hypothetical protein [Flavobacterium psychrophilum]ELM3726436.1 hypothetical protein [Flavobacterium psychrophilum]ELV7526221.1 hypothetical protein [Flavobacterium psychrophilum]
MSYSVNKITTIADCDLLLAWAAKEKADLNFKKLSEERLTNNYSTASIEIDAELQSVITEIAATETIIATLPAGNSKEDAVKKKVRLEYKKFLLQNKKESYGVVALLEKELDLTKVTLELTEIDNFTNAIITRKAAL